MKRIKSLTTCMIVMCVLAGCGNVGSTPHGGEGTVEESSIPQGSQEESSGEGSGGSSVEGTVESSEESSVESAAEPYPEETPSENTAAVNEMELSEEEQAFFTDFIRERENYGFLLSEYDAPKDVNLFEVLYGGAGFGEWIPEEEKALYLEKVQEDEIYTDCVKMSRQDIDDFLHRKLGVGLEEMSTPLEMVYLEETDAYYNQAGDTNYVPFACAGGTRQGDTYTLHFTPADDWAEGERETVLVKTEDGYQFVSNHILTQ